MTRFVGPSDDPGSYYEAEPGFEMEVELESRKLAPYEPRTTTTVTFVDRQHTQIEQLICRDDMPGGDPEAGTVTVHLSDVAAARFVREWLRRYTFDDLIALSQ